MPTDGLSYLAHYFKILFLINFTKYMSTNKLLLSYYKYYQVHSNLNIIINNCKM